MPRRQSEGNAWLEFRTQIGAEDDDDDDPDWVDLLVRGDGEEVPVVHNDVNDDASVTVQSLPSTAVNTPSSSNAPSPALPATSDNHKGQPIITPHGFSSVPVTEASGVANRPNASTATAPGSTCISYDSKDWEHHGATNANFGFTATAPRSDNVAAVAKAPASANFNTPSSNINTVNHALMNYGNAVDMAMGPSHPHKPHVTAYRTILSNEIAKLRARDAELDKREAALRAKMKLAGDKEASVQMRFKDVEEAEAAFMKRCQNFENEKEELRIWEKETTEQFEERGEKLDAREEAMDAAEVELVARCKALDEHEARLKDGEKQLADREAKLHEDHGEHNCRVELLQDRVKSFMKRELGLKTAHDESPLDMLENCVDELNKKLATLKTKEQKRAEALADLQELGVVLNIRQKRLDAKAEELMAERETIAAREKEVNLVLDNAKKASELHDEETEKPKQLRTNLKQNRYGVVQRKRTVTLREIALEAAKNKVSNKQIENPNVAADLAHREADLKHDQDTLLKSQRKLAEDRKALVVKEDALNEREYELEKHEIALQDSQVTLVNDMAALGKREQELSDRENSLREREQDCTNGEASLKKREESLAVRVEKADQRKGDLVVRAQDLEEQELTLKSRRGEIDAARADLTREKKNFHKAAQAVRGQKAKVDRLEKELIEREQALKDSEEKNKRQKRKLTNRENELDERKVGLDMRERELNAREDDLDAEEQEKRAQDAPES
jgi:hypothetical protein